MGSGATAVFDARLSKIQYKLINKWGNIINTNMFKYTYIYVICVFMGTMDISENIVHQNFAYFRAVTFKPGKYGALT